MKIALTIAGSDSGAGAGIQADLKTFASLGVYGTSAVTAVTAQNTVGVSSFQEVSPELVRDQIETLYADFQIDAAKTGMLASSKIIDVVAECVKKFNIDKLVVDPVMISKSGHRLLASEAEKSLTSKLIPLALVVTPNLKEAEALCGFPVNSAEEMKKAARVILQKGARSVVVKGGHLKGDAVDIFYDGKDFHQLKSPRIQTRNDHGTGCTFSAAIAGYLALGKGLTQSVLSAKEYITQAIQYSYSVGKGHSPVNHFFRQDRSN
ncbi:MAG: bifunctional hydroxymethylpyrimidine kinase/phosphomethylpyrimidine kinase [candidate division Zixibacteria bacterium]|nr:bifunctional hydroxymethylpyrimidine kinase/phosphomethylpyrimidine kinase [candidate division Zixibacteria bacterium]